VKFNPALLLLHNHTSRGNNMCLLSWICYSQSALSC